jgi:YHS domain-containing protein
MMRSLFLLALAFVALTPPVRAGAITCTFQMDPVELVAGRETLGNADISADRYQYRYVFANERNRDVFLAHPEEFEIQLGGACGRMGVLSGAGDPERFAVHDGKIYIFASDGCRNTFLKDPSAVLETEDAPITADPESVVRARELIDRCIESMGGADRVDAVRSYRQIEAKEVVSQNEKHTQSDSLLIVFPSGVRTDYAWDASRWTTVESPAGGWYDAKGDRRELQPVERRAMHRNYRLRTPLAMLRARNEPGFVCAYAGPRSITLRGKRVSVEEVHCSFDGCTVTLGFDPNSGLVRTQSFVALRSRISDVIHVFSNHRDVGGLKLPNAYDVLIDGELKEGSAVAYTSIALDEPGAADELKPVD